MEIRSIDFKSSDQWSERYEDRSVVVGEHRVSGISLHKWTRFLDRIIRRDYQAQNEFDPETTAQPFFELSKSFLYTAAISNFSAYSQKHYLTARFRPLFTADTKPTCSTCFRFLIEQLSVKDAEQSKTCKTRPNIFYANFKRQLSKRISKAMSLGRESTGSKESLEGVCWL